jgi:hypothetical protein
MQVQFETIVRRANAEGLTLSAVMSALTRLEREAREKAVKVAQEGWHGAESVEDGIVVGRLTSTRYCGGYMYRGHDVTPGQFQEHRWSRPGDSSDADPEGATEWVRSAPLGAEVTVKVDFGNGTSLEVFRKLSEGWATVHTWDESEVRWAEDGPYLYQGIRADVARAVGCGESAVFHSVFDLAVENLSS